MIESVGVMVGVVSGLSGLVLSVLNVFREKKRDMREKERDMREKERDMREKEQLEEQKKRNRMEDMKIIFLDKDIPRKTRDPFFEEFVRLGGNGLYARMWLEEGAALEK
jgi:hypothetical protein